MKTSEQANKGNQLLTTADIRKQTECSPAAILSWITCGVDGLRLRATKYGRQWKVRQSDLDDFIATLTKNSLPDDAAPIPEITNQRETKKRAEAAMDRLRKKGVPIS